MTGAVDEREATPTPASRRGANLAFATARLLAAIVAVVGYGSCGKKGEPARPQMPSLEEVEPNVVALVKQWHDRVASEPTSQNWAQYARVLHAHEMAQEALTAYEAALAATKTPDERFELLYLAGHSTIKWNPDRSIALFNEAEQIKPEYIPLHLRAGDLHVLAERWPDARRHFSEAAQQAESLPEFDRKSLLPQALLGLGRVHIAQGNPEVAVKVLERARSVDREVSEVHATLAIAYARVGRKVDAAKAGKEAGNLMEPVPYIDPLAVGVHSMGVSYLSLEQFGRSALRSREFAKALDYFERAIATRPDSTDGLHNKAIALNGLGRYPEAEPLLDKVLAERPNEPGALTHKGACLMARGEHVKAVPVFRRALEVEPRQANARLNLAKTLRHLKQPSEAKQHLRILLEQRPSRMDARLDLASLLADEGQNAEAMVEIEQVLAAEPSNEKAKALKARLPR